jgi:hypothetical protein
VTGYNHVATGAIIGLAIKEPALALPLAFVSHFVLDSLPHYGIEYAKRKQFPAFKRILSFDAVITPLAIILIHHEAHSWLVFGTMVLAVTPDFGWFIKYAYDKHKRTPFSLPRDPFSRFHKRIQWGERPDGIGMGIELIYAILASAIILALV